MWARAQPRGIRSARRSARHERRRTQEREGMPGQRAGEHGGRDERAMRVVAEQGQNVGIADGFDLVRSRSGALAPMPRGPRQLEIRPRYVDRLGIRGCLPRRGVDGKRRRNARVCGSLPAHRRLPCRTKARQHDQRGDGQSRQGETTQLRKVWLQGNCFFSVKDTTADLHGRPRQTILTSARDRRACKPVRGRARGAGSGAERQAKGYRL